MTLCSQPLSGLILRSERSECLEGSGGHGSRRRFAPPHHEAERDRAHDSYFVAFSRNRISAARSSGEPMRCSGILVPGV
jgi:hypothetical protein